MSNGTNPTKKGLSPLAWTAIGCGCLVLLAGAVTVGLLGYGAYKAKEFVEEAESKPVTTLARAYAALNPEVELVTVDEEARLVTFRNTETDEVITIDAADLEEGRISFGDGEGTSTIAFESGEEGGDAGLTVTGPDGSTRFRAGSGDADVPDWVPRYPDAAVEGSYFSSTTEQSGGTLSLSTTASATDVLTFYTEQLEAGGWTIEQNSTYNQGGTEGGALGAKHAEERRTLNVTVGQAEDETTIVLIWSDTP